jgi:hypothetical protein
VLVLVTDTAPQKEKEYKSKHFPKVQKGIKCSRANDLGFYIHPKHSAEKKNVKKTDGKNSLAAALKRLHYNKHARRTHKIVLSRVLS